LTFMEYEGIATLGVIGIILVTIIRTQFGKN
jgi:hypothetical protein